MKIAVLGAGAWGTALAILWSRDGHDVTLVARDDGTAEALTAARENAARLPGILFPGALAIKAPESFSADVVVLALPARATADMITRHPDLIPDGVPLILTAKGLDPETGDRQTDTVRTVAPGHALAVLSGPSFAADVAAGKPTAVTLAAETADLARELAQTLSTRHFRLYPSADVDGVEDCGALKNVYAIAAGIATGLDLGASAQAALIARAHAEMSRLVRARGGAPETPASLAGLGDLVLTCSSPQSRNMRFGQRLGEGHSTDDALAASSGVVEGIATAAAIDRLADEYNLDMPVARAVAAVLEAETGVVAAIATLLDRPVPHREH